MCNCGKGIKAVRSPGDSPRSLMPKSGEISGERSRELGVRTGMIPVWFHSPSLGDKKFATHGGVSGMLYYFRHDQETMVRAGDAEWLIENPNRWVKPKPSDATLARSGYEYSVYTPSASGTVVGTLTYNFSSGESKRVLNIDLPAVQAAVPGTIS